MLGEKPKKVECLTCHGQHVFKANAPGSKEKKKRLSKGTTKSKGKNEAEKKKTRLERIKEKENEEWRSALASRDLGTAKPYAMSSSYTIDDIVDHSKFGIGVVTNVINSQKMEILFEDGYKLMVYNS